MKRLSYIEDARCLMVKYFGPCAEMRTCALPIKTQECQPLERDVRCICTDIPDQASDTLSVKLPVSSPKRHMREWRYSRTYSELRRYMEVSGQFDAPSALFSGKDPTVSIEYQAGRDQNLPGIERRSLHCPVP